MYPVFDVFLYNMCNRLEAGQISHAKYPVFSLTVYEVTVSFHITVLKLVPEGSIKYRSP